MICVSVTPTSRTLAPADLLNAGRQGDIVELCLDHFIKEPDVGDLISAIDKPLIVSCRRPQDGGHWQGTEDQRLMLLRQAIVAGPAYVELDLDIAPKIPRFGKTQRVISFTRMDRPETDIEGIFDEAANAKADVVKFTWPTPDLDAAWPLLAAVAQKRAVPVVGMGLGREELTFSLLGLKYGSPWVYAALEPGREAHPGQATVFDFAETYHCRDINSKTTFIAIAGFSPAQIRTTRVLNAGLKTLGVNARCLPVRFGEMKQVAKMLDVLKIRAVIDAGAGTPGLGAALQANAGGDSAGSDLFLKKDDGWHGHITLRKQIAKVLESGLGPGHSLERHNTLILGTGSAATGLAADIAQRGGVVSVCGPDDKRAKAIAQSTGCRFVPFQNLYDTLADLVLIADETLTAGTKHGQLNPAVFRPHMTVFDAVPRSGESELADEARFRGAKVIDSRDLRNEQLRSWFKLISSKDLPEKSLSAAEE